MLRFTRSFLWGALAAVALTAGCGGGGSAIVGTWVSAPDALDEFEEFTSLPEEQRTMIRAQNGTFELEMTFTSDKMTAVAKFMGQNHPKEFSYKVKSDTGNKMVFETTDEDGKVETVGAEIKGDLLLLSKGNNEKFALRRK